MVFKSINRIKAALPEVIHIAMFYNNGTIFQTTFGSDINIPKLGENLAEALHHMQKIYEFCNLKAEEYKKLIFETEDMSSIILKLGEDSNIALFFKKEEDKELRISAIRRYLNKIEDIMDMDANEILFQEILVKEEELKKLNNDLQKNQEEINILNEKVKDSGMSQERQMVLKKINENTEEYFKIKKQIEEVNSEIENLKKEIVNK
ncbi:MAG: coiled-coil domain-containing protein [Promethearchaeota archaeon]